MRTAVTAELMQRMKSNHFGPLAAILVLVCAGSTLSQLCAAENLNTATADEMRSDERDAGQMTLAESAEAPNRDKSASNAISFDIVVKDGRLVCPRHKWTFDLETGQCIAGDRSVNLYDLVPVEDA